MLALSATSVTKIFKKENGQNFTAVDNIDLQIEKGQIYGLLGPNGAGKSTLINIISGILLPDAGELKLFGVDVLKNNDETKKMLGVVPQEIVVEPAFTVEEVLYYFSGMYGVPAKERKQRIIEVLTDLDLLEKKNERARKLSGGMKRRLMIAKAILHRPQLLILDEPTAGVDVALRQKIWNLIRRLNQEGATILFTTHYLEEAEQLCESITLVDHGRKIKEGKVKDILKEFSRNVVHFEIFDQNAKHLKGVRKVGKEFEFPVTNLTQDMPRLLEYYDGNIKSIRNENASLEQIFLELTGTKK